MDHCILSVIGLQIALSSREIEVDERGVSRYKLQNWQSYDLLPYAWPWPLFSVL